jgi:molecular chaperone DnaK (HSP70)
VALRGAGAGARIDVTRAQFEEMTKDLLDKSIDIVRRTLDTLAEKEPGATIDEVLLVGGSTSMPAVSERLRAEFGWEPKLHDPHLAVAKGAALYALGRVVHREQEEAREQATSAADADVRAADAVQELEARTGISAGTLSNLADKQHSNVLPKAFGVKLLDTSEPGWESNPRFYVTHLVHANDSLPTGWRELNARTVYEGQTEIEVELYEQSGAKPGPEMIENKHLNDGKGTIRDLPSVPQGSPIHIQMQVDAEGLLTVKAKEETTGKDLTINVKVSILSEEQVQLATEAVSALTVSG